jgi:hypothetical protein
VENAAMAASPTAPSAPARIQVTFVCIRLLLSWAAERGPHVSGVISVPARSERPGRAS